MAQPLPEPDEAALHLAWAPELEDWYDVFAARRRHRRTDVRLAAVAGLLLATVVAGLVLDARVVVAPAVGGLVGLAILRAGLGRIVRRFWKAHAPIRAPHTAVADGSGLTLTSEHATTTYPWAGLGTVLETDRLFVVHIGGDRAFLPLPKRGLADPADLDRLRALLTRAR